MRPWIREVGCATTLNMYRLQAQLYSMHVNENMLCSAVYRVILCLFHSKYEYASTIPASKLYICTVHTSCIA